MLVCAAQRGQHAQHGQHGQHGWCGRHGQRGQHVQQACKGAGHAGMLLGRGASRDTKHPRSWSAANECAGGGRCRPATASAPQRWHWWERQEGSPARPAQVPGQKPSPAPAAAPATKRSGRNAGAGVEGRCRGAAGRQAPGQAPDSRGHTLAQANCGRARPSCKNTNLLGQQVARQLGVDDARVQRVGCRDEDG